MLSFRKFHVAKRFTDKRGDTEYKCFPSTFFSHSAKKFCRGTLLCVRRFLESKKITDEMAGGGSITIFCRIFFISQYRRFLQGNPSVLCFRNFPVGKN